MLRLVTGVLIRILVGLGITVSGGAQTADFAPNFETVSIKPVAAPDNCFALQGEFNRDDTLIDYRGVRLAEVIEKAYGIDLQMGTGPASIWTQRYDIQAKIRPDTAASQVPAMLQRLLVRRFDLKVHTVAAEHEEYWLLVSKGGLKMRPARPPQGKAKSSCSLTIMPKGGVGVRIVANGFTMRAVAVSLGFRLETRVVDKTEVEGAFEFEAEYLPPRSRWNWDLRLGPFVGVFYPEEASHPSPPPYPSIPAALEEQLGLRLERRLTSADVLVVDHANPTPTRRELRED